MGYSNFTYSGTSYKVQIANLSITQTSCTGAWGPNRLLNGIF